MACGCSKKAAQQFVVTIPGQPPRTVTGEAAAITLTKGVSGARYSQKG